MILLLLMPKICMRLFDLHCDTLYGLTEQDGDILQNDGHVDCARGCAFSPWYQCFAMWVQDGIGETEATVQIKRMLKTASRFEKRYPTLFHVLRNGSELFSTPRTPLTAILTIENGGVAAGGDAVPVGWITSGVKMVSLTWNGGNRWAEGCEGDFKKGLTAAGKRAVRTMEANGILLDAAHLNRRSFWDLCKLSTRPFIVSHTASAAVHPSARALNDMQFLQIKQRGGIVGLDLCAAHLGGIGTDRFIAHLEHFLSLGGKQTVSLGCDLDGIDLPPQYNGMRILETLYDRLLQRNYAESLIDDLFYDNAYRFMKRYIR